MIALVILCCAGLCAAFDEPDLCFLDTDCDGVDGSLARAIFCAQSGRIGGSGAADDP